VEIYVNYEMVKTSKQKWRLILKKLINLIFALIFRSQLFSYINIKYTYFIIKYHSDGKCWLTSLDRYMIKKHNVRNEQKKNLVKHRFDNIENLNCKLWSVL